MMRRFASAFAALMLCSILVYAQTDFKQQFDAFTKSASLAHTEFTDSVNAAFAEALKSQWEHFRTDSAAVRRVKPVPDTAVYNGGQDSTAGFKLPISVIIAPGGSCLHQAPETSMFNVRNMKEASRPVNFIFYGTPLSLRIPVSYGEFHPEGISEDDVSSFWKELSRHDYMSVVQRCKACRDEMGLNDWAILKWAQSLAEAVFPYDIHSERAVFAVFLLNQLGLKAKTARSGESLVCLFPAEQQIYGVRYITLDDVPYYIAGEDKDVSDLFTYRADFPRQSRAFDMNVREPLSLGKGSEPIVCDKESSVFHTMLHVPIDIATMSFYDGYPQMDPIVYATAAPVEAFGKEIIGSVKNMVRDYPDDLERLGAILHFVQADFGYKVDSEQFGREKPFFCEENFLYKYNDCEDRAALLSYLVRNVLGLRTLLLDYPDHMAVAVELSDDINGDYVNHDGGRFYVCDPSYIGAPVGRSIPRYRTVPVKLWEVY